MASKFTCTICLDNFTKPKFLPCYHTFCQQCIDDYIKAHAHFNKFNCPICRQQTELPSGGASQFVTNFYLEDDDDDKQYCTKHKKKEIEVYCLDCRKPCCSVCVMVDHENHTKTDLDGVDREIRDEFLKLKTESENKIKQLQEHSDFLKRRMSDVINSCKAACDNVDKKIESICEKARTIGGAIKDDINKIGEDENSKLTKLVEDVDKMTSKMKEWCEYADRILQHKSQITAVDKHGLIDLRNKTCYNISVHLPKPDVIYPYFPMVEVDEDCLAKLLGEIQTTFTSTFSTRDFLIEDVAYFSVGLIINGLAWCVGVGDSQEGYRGYVLCIQLGMNTVEDKTIKAVTASYTVKLLNINDESKSLVQQGTDIFTPGDGIVAIDIEMDKLDDFTDNNRIFTVHVAVNIIDIER